MLKLRVKKTEAGEPMQVFTTNPLNRKEDITRSAISIDRQSTAYFEYYL